MQDLISRQAAIDAVKSEKVKVFHELYDEAWNDAINGCIDVIEQLPPAEPELIKCDYVKACNEVTMNKTFSAWRYLDMLDDFEEEGYILVKRRG